jgi:hypothetical protein
VKGSDRATSLLQAVLLHALAADCRVAALPSELAPAARAAAVQLPAVEAQLGELHEGLGQLLQQVQALGEQEGQRGGGGGRADGMAGPQSDPRQLGEGGQVGGGSGAQPGLAPRQHHAQLSARYQALLAHHGRCLASLQRLAAWFGEAFVPHEPTRWGAGLAGVCAGWGFGALGACWGPGAAAASGWPALLVGVRGGRCNGSAGSEGAG